MCVYGYFTNLAVVFLEPELFYYAPLTDPLLEQATTGVLL